MLNAMQLNKTSKQKIMLTTSSGGKFQISRKHSQKKTGSRLWGRQGSDWGELRGPTFQFGFWIPSDKLLFDHWRELDFSIMFIIR